MSVTGKERWLKGLSVSQKGMLVVLVPLATAMICMAMVAVIVFHSFREIDREYHARCMSEQTTVITKSIFDIAVSLGRYQIGHQPEMLTQFDMADKRIAQSLKYLQEQARGSEVEPVQALIADTQEFVKLGRGIRQEMPHGSGLESVDSLLRIKALNRKMNSIEEHITAFANELAMNTSEDPRRLMNISTTMMAIIAAAMVATVMTALAMIGVYSKSIIDPLKILSDNSARLARNQSLHPLIGGSDELGHLDRVFHDMAGALAEASRKERAVIEHASDVICSIDADGRFTNVSAAAQKVWGYAPGEMIGRPCTDLIAAEDLPLASKSFLEAMEAEGEPQNFETRVVRKDGTLVNVLWSAQWVHTEESMFCVVHDFSERYEVERLKREFVSTVSHELRTPLTAIRGSLTLLSVGALGKLGEQADKMVKVAERNCLRLISLINDLLDIEKLQAGKLEMVIEDTPFTPIVERSVESVRAFAEQYAVDIHVEQCEALVSADGDRIVQVLVNLLSNAVKYSPRDAQVVLSTSKRGERLRVEVRDQGRGIPADMLNSVFERFQQVETSDSRQHGGTGLGLAICKSIVEQHKGQIGVSSEVGKGSVFWFELPLVQSRQAVQAEPVPGLAAHQVLIGVQPNKGAEERS